MVSLSVVLVSKFHPECRVSARVLHRLSFVEAVSGLAGCLELCCWELLGVASDVPVHIDEALRCK